MGKLKVYCEGLPHSKTYLQDKYTVIHALVVDIDVVLLARVIQ